MLNAGQDSNWYGVNTDMVLTYMLINIYIYIREIIGVHHMQSSSSWRSCCWYVEMLWSLLLMMMLSLLLLLAVVFVVFVVITVCWYCRCCCCCCCFCCCCCSCYYCCEWCHCSCIKYNNNDNISNTFCYWCCSHCCCPGLISLSLSKDLLASYRLSTGFAARTWMGPLA